MKCPYRYSSTKHIEQTENNLVHEETGVNKGVTINYVEIYNYCKCEKEECAVYYDGKCHYNG